MKSESKLSKPYFFGVAALTIIFPVLSVLADRLINKDQMISIPLAGKWFIFWAVGMRLLIAGLRQVINPAFTAKEIFHIDNKEAWIIVRELGFANICLGLIGILSLFIPEWRMVSAFAGSLFYGIAGVNHAIRKLVGPNEIVAMVSDIFIFFGLMLYLFFSLH